jgi:SpoVK/Ycf46/Vps4 family AAA+-type ATPase
MVVDIPKLRSMWVGETEKNMKAVFEHYRDCVKKSDLYPILLFNEADAIIGKRKSGAEGAVDKMENSLLNIVLQEMERLDGIMIATTNLEENMDKAFERRFLYKIKFEKPSLEARTQIWRSMIPELKESDVQTLASRYDFSGGQIENIARHYAIDSILHDQSDDALAMLISHCDSERLESKNTGRIGF